MPLESHSSPATRECPSVFRDNPLVSIPDGVQRECAPCDSSGVFSPQQSYRSLCDSSSVLRMPAPIVSDVDTCSVERKAIQRKKPIVRSPPALSLTVGNVSLSVVVSLFRLHSSLFLLLCRQCRKFKSFSLPSHRTPI